MKWSEWAESEVAAIERASLDRHIRTFDGRGVVLRTEEGREVVSFASNDYFNLTAHPVVIEAARAATAQQGAGAGSARLIAGSRPSHERLERSLAGWKGEPSALLFPSGYAANVGVLTTFGTEGTTIFSDELNHASIVDGCRTARAEVEVYPHRDMKALEQALARADRAIVVTDLVFSMDGDVAPIEELADLCRRHGALLVTDEAHAALGPETNLEEVEHLRVGTLSKMLGSVGGFVAGETSMVRLLINRARSFVFTTAGSPSDVAAAEAALRVLRSDEGARLKERLRGAIDLLAPDHPSPILTATLGDEETTLKASRLLFERGLLVPAIRPPTVPAERSRLRISLSSGHTDEHLEELRVALDDIGVALDA